MKSTTRLNKTLAEEIQKIKPLDQDNLRAATPESIQNGKSALDALRIEIRESLAANGYKEEELEALTEALLTDELIDL